MPKFTSKNKGLVLQDGVEPAKGDGVWARFEDGVFETNDAKVAARLRDVEGVEEIATEEPADKPLEKRTPAELKKYAADNGIDLGDATKKEDILAAIAAAAVPPQS